MTAPAAWTVVSNSGDPAVGDGDGARTLDLPRHAAARRRTTPSSTPGRSTRSAARWTATTSACSRAGPSRPGLERDADELFTLTAQGLRVLRRRLRDAVPAAEVRPGVRARVRWCDGELRLRHVVRLLPAPVRPRPVRRTRLLASYLLHEMAHMWFGNIVTMRWWDDLWLNEAFAEFAANWAAATRHLVHRRLGRPPGRREARGPTSPTRGPPVAPDPPAHPRRRAGRRRSSTRSPIPRAPRCCTSSWPTSARSSSGRDDGVLRRARLGQHHAAGPDRRARRAQRPGPGRAGGPGGWRPPAPTGSPWTGRVTTSCSIARGPAGAAASAGAGGRRLPSAHGDGLDRTALARVDVQGERHAGRAARGPTSTWSTTTT